MHFCPTFGGAVQYGTFSPEVIIGCSGGGDVMKASNVKTKARDNASLRSGHPRRRSAV